MTPDSPFKKAFNSSLYIEHIEHIEQHIELYMPLQILYRLGVAV